MSRVAVLGQRDAVLGFKASGAVAFSADDPEEAKKRLAEILEGDFAVLFVTEEVADILKEELQPLYDKPKPVVTILPDARNSKGIGMGSCARGLRGLSEPTFVKGEE